ncbi:MAG TPA: hypothetical protein VHB79_03965 [Polyangiaceae bacterium]|nr:hypothetical protein [Polyangiaceae bacterium]
MAFRAIMTLTSSTAEKKPPRMSPEAIKADADFNLWAKHEDIAMHFNDLNMRWRLQAMGGLATLVTVGGFVVATCYRGMLIFSGTLMCAWSGIHSNVELRRPPTPCRQRDRRLPTRPSPTGGAALGRCAP